MNLFQSAARRHGRVGVGTRIGSGLVAMLTLFAANAVAANAQGLPDSNLMDRTEDGWGIEVNTLDEEVNPVPNLAATAFSREAFVQFTGTGKITGQGSYPVTSASLTIGYQLGCQIDVSQGITLGGSAGVGVGAGALGGIAGIVGFGAGGVGVGAGVSGNLQFTLRPGGIVAIPMDSMALKGNEARLRVRNMHLKIDACGGPVTARSFTLLSVTSDFTHSSLATYGEPIQI
ncbi:MspA family porin [Mycobacteroides abscessus]|nr:MspA family porin [Mycobacteroides abscessus]